MKIIFVRHANPDYELDRLTKLGRIQAEAVSTVLCEMGIERVYSSSNNRALETADFTAKKLSLDVVKCDFIREINWGMKDSNLPYNQGDPWSLARKYLQNGLALNDENWKTSLEFSKTNTPESVEKLAKGLDEWLCSLGFERDGFYYRVKKPVYKTVAIFCHAGAFAGATSHLFNLPYPFTLLTFPFDQTGISIVEIGGKEGDLAVPTLRCLGNVDHLKNSGIEIT
ncbi:MAG: histidine phosphatase family protein [Clostridia bacterium]|nr:histidine phosphatase family protein [Clostridia bacterium]